MTSIRFHLRPSLKGPGYEGKLFIRVIHRRRIKTIPTPYSLFPGEWNGGQQTVNLPGCDAERYLYLQKILQQVKSDLARHSLILSRLSGNGIYSASDIAGLLMSRAPGESMYTYCEKVVRQLENRGQHRTARAYRSAVTSFSKFMGRPASLSEIDDGRMKAYEKYLLGQGLQLNTVSFYMRNLRAIYYRAVKDKLIRRREDNPFGDVYTGVYETRRRALSDTELNRLASLTGKLDGAENSGLKQALFIFLFCFHARGMSFADMAGLRKSDIKGNTLLYKRCKTGRWLELKVNRQMKEIIRYFDRADSEMVFPVADPRKGDMRRQYLNGLGRQNAMLAKLRRMAGIEKKVTTHVTRHTWATAAKRAGVDIAVISEGLGHGDIRTTYRYLASFERSTLDKVSDKVSAIVKTDRGAA